ncbi:MAG: calcium-binding protein, partial [Planctomycetia bacterium]|nr:calcium-binding protein [Planctomycetia bacterium]
GEANVLVIDLIDTSTTPVITITEEAMKNLDAIHIETEVENIIVIEDAGEPAPGTQVADHFVIDSATDVYDNPTAVAITANESGTGSQIAKTTSSGTKSIEITSTEGKPTQYDINTLSTNVQINTNTDSTDTISFAGSNSQAGIVLNLDKTEYSQSVYTGQAGTLKLNGTPGEVVLSPGNDIVTGSSAGSVITDLSTDSWNTITLNGANTGATNVVNLNSGSTIIVNGEATNKIAIDNADNTVINLSKATGTTETTITGNNATITGGTGKNVINLTGDYGIVNSPNCTEDMFINIIGNNAIVKTGKGNDIIHIMGNDSLVSTGDGNDKIYLEGSSNGNSVSTGNGDDIVISTSTGGNTIYTDGGNDFVIGGDGRDRIFGGTGNSLLAGGKGADRIIGGTGRDIILANISSKLQNKTVAQLEEIRDKLFETKPWWDNLDYALEVLGTSSISDGAVDTLSRESNTGIDVFFRNLLEEDGKDDTVANALENDRIYG